jgi:cyclophilin family peptidyl-prolyl cis-trans isomerase
MPTKFAKPLFALLVFSLATLISCSSSPPPAADPAAAPEVKEEAPPDPTPPVGDPYATIQTSEGDIVVRLRPDLAPRTVENFITLANRSFYYGTKFHRVIAGTIIQGGDPNSRDTNPYNDGQGNSGAFVPAEFSKEPFRRGSVAMARSPGNPNSASCQFFIVLKRMSQWDGEYTIFGEVTEGIELADKMARSALSKDPQLRERPTANYTIRQVLIDYR